MISNMSTTTFPPELAPLPDSSSSTSALYLRLNLLEDLLFPPTPSRIPEETTSTTFDNRESDGDEPQGPRPGRDLTSRLEALERGLQDLLRGSGSGKESLRRFVDRCESSCFSCFFPSIALLGFILDESGEVGMRAGSVRRLRMRLETRRK